MKKIALVTINYNAASDTKKMLNSIAYLSHPDFTLMTIIVDNASRDKFVLEKQNEKIKVINS